MAFVEVQELADYLKLGSAELLSETVNTSLRTNLEIAESTVAVEIGAPALAAEDISETVTLPRERNSIQVTHGPIADPSMITKVQVSGYDAMDLDDVRLPHYWVIWRTDVFPAGIDITVEYTRGWEEGDSAGDSDLPTGIRHAIILTAADFYQNPDKSVVSERIGDWAITRSGTRVSDVVSEMPERARKLISPYMKPEF